MDTLHLTVFYSSGNDFSATACESYEWDGETYTQSGDYTRTYQDIHGADSVVTLHLTINYGTHNVESIATCGSAEWHGVTYTESGTYTYEYDNAYGCASVDTLHLTVNPIYDIEVYDTVMQNQQYIFGDFTVQTADTGLYTYDFQYSTSFGCDSTIHLVLYVMYNDGIHTSDFPTIEVFPNPTHTVLNIKGAEMQKILIYNADGHLVYAKEGDWQSWATIDVSFYATGLYFVKIVLPDGRFTTRKFIVKKQ